MKSILKKLIPARVVKILAAKRDERRMAKMLALEEMSEEFILRKNFYSQLLKPGDTYFDIGANYGNRIGPIRAAGVKTIIAVEPQEGCCTYLRSRFKDITVLQKGVGAAAGKQEFFISNETVLSSFSKEFIAKTGGTRFSENSWERSEVIEIITLDSLIAEHGMPDFIKVDVEGFETEVFKGLSQPVKLVSFEYTVPELADNILPIVEKLYSLGRCTFNYSCGESMLFEMESWISVEEMRTLINSEEFLKTGFGDIYVQYSPV